MRETNIQSIEKRVYELEKNSGGGGSSADKVSYNNSISGLVADNVQNAIDEVHEEIENYKHHYSTEEKIVGEWIDGSPVYEITKAFDGNGTTRVIVTGVKDIISASGYTVDYSNEKYYINSNSGSLTNNVKVINNEIRVVANTTYDRGVITVTYTKNE